MPKQLSFSNIRFKDIKDLVPVTQHAEENVFDEWFNFEYELSEEEIAFLKSLIKRSRLKVNSYTEEELKAKFLIPILNKVDFMQSGISDWYERSLKGQINGVEIGGVTDYMVAQGIKEPETPYFFIQEFKPSKPSVFPEDQLLAELIVSLQLNGTQHIKGAYIVGQFWTFVILERNMDGAYKFHIAPSLDSLKIEDLKHIYKNLQAAKAEIMQFANADVY